MKYQNFKKLKYYSLGVVVICLGFVGVGVQAMQDPIGRYDMTIVEHSFDRPDYTCAFYLTEEEGPATQACHDLGGLGLKVPNLVDHNGLWLEIESIAENGDVTGSYMRWVNTVWDICPACVAKGVYVDGELTITDQAEAFWDGFFEPLWPGTDIPNDLYFKLKFNGDSVSGTTNFSNFGQPLKIYGTRAPALESYPENQRRLGKSEVILDDNTTNLNNFKFVYYDPMFAVVPGELAWRLENNGVLRGINDFVSGGFPGWYGENLATVKSYHDFNMQVDICVGSATDSGIYLRGRYEIQVRGTDDPNIVDKENTTGAIFGRISPTSNEVKLNDDGCPSDANWNTMEVTLVGRNVTVILNGVKIIDDEEIAGPTGGALDTNEAKPGPVIFQKHTEEGFALRRLTITPIHKK